MPISYEDFKWREVQPGTWRRGVDEAESFYHHLMRCYEGSGRKYFAITGHITLTIEETGEGGLNDVASRMDAALRSAWLQLRLDCPTVASQIIYDTAAKSLNKQYKVLGTSESHEAWLQQTFQRVSNGQTGVEWCNSDPPAPDLATLFVIVPPSENGTSGVRRDVVLRAPHDIIDGMGTLHLLNSLVVNAAAAYANPSAINVGGGEEPIHSVESDVEAAKNCIGTLS
ncbi:hypothetical protein NQ176_g2712 [Zarea fungicola]|uniref:Uncharacterized protein n=1 Tax=Zarea fungicola TaxID=93591 RepID=A0ACC1NP67_9HYPO|nr:hypothetical protein NQ176_g2712 [Lecanicillium fungicola]